MAGGMTSAPPDAAAIDHADRALETALAALSGTQREIDALHARRARELVAVIGRARAAQAALGEASRSRREEFARRSARAEVALALRIGERSADRLLSEAETLVRDLPAVLEASASGTISWAAARTVALEGGVLAVELRRALAGDRDGDAAHARLAAFDAGAVELARRTPPARLRGRLGALRERLHPVAAEVRHESARAERHLALEDLPDGLTWIHALLPSVEAHAIMHRLTAVARAAVGLDAAEGVVGARTLEQRRADLLVDFLVGDRVRVDGDGGPPDAPRGRRSAEGRDFGRFAGIRPEVVVTVPVQALLPRPDGLPSAAEPAMLDGVVPIDPVVARRLVGDATSLYRLLVDPHRGVRLDLSRERYRVTNELRMWLRLRDEHCRFPGCGRLARGCDVDHVLAWQHGGETGADNLAHLCRGHHTLKHQTSWRVEPRPDGALSWTAPSGAVHATSPPNVFARSG